jgi:subtilisin-like proprotein convertase family protein
MISIITKDSHVSVICTVLLIFCSFAGTFAQEQPKTILDEPPIWKDFEKESEVDETTPVYALLAPTCDRASIINDYNTNYIGSSVSNAELGWTGNTATCTAGTISVLAQTRTFQRINYYRRHVGLPGTITYDPSHDAETQEASLIFKANGALSHNPPNTWMCYTAAGATGAANSNIGLGSHSSNTIRGYMDDGGAGNTAVGHRRWILYSRANSFGHGSTDASDALWVFNPTITPPPGQPPFIAFPPKGYTPRDLIPPRWSFGIPNANFSAATVEVRDENNTLYGITQHAFAGNFGDNTVVWDMPGGALTWNGILDKAFKVKVSGVTIGGVGQAPYEYTIVAIDLTTPVLNVTSTNASMCNGVSLNNGSATANFDHGAKSYLWNTGGTTQTITGLAPGVYTVVVTDKNDCTHNGMVTVIENPMTSVPTLVASPPFSCAAGQAITLTAANCNGTLNWSNGLGTGTTKTVNPAVTTTYSVTCTEGACSSPAVSVTLPVLKNATCTPTATNGHSPFYGVAQFDFNTINSASGSSQAEGANYVDRTCTTSTTVTAGNTYSMTVDGEFTNSHEMKVYIDYNNNGDFTDAGEIVMNGSSNAPITNNVAIPATATLDVPLRVRVLADPSATSNSCTIVGNAGFGSGQIEDFAVIITSTTPSLAIVATSANKAEGNAGNTAFTFTVTRTGNTAGASSANWAVTGSSGSPANAADFGGALPNGTVNFAGGSTTETITINVNGDVDMEPDEGFTVTLSTPTNANITTATANGTIQNDDGGGTPTIAITGSPSQNEGNAGATAFTFTVNRTGNTANQSSAVWAVTGSGGSPANTTDFTGGVLPAGTVTFPAGSGAAQTITINVNGDTNVEPNEAFTVTLSTPVNATITTATASGTILDDDDGGVICTSYAATDTPINIQDNSTITSTLNVPVTGTLTDVNILNLNGTHSYVGDLTFTLTSPQGTPVVLIQNQCVSEDNFDISLDDGAANTLPIDCPFSGGDTEQPMNPLATFNGQDPAGNWTLTVNDNAGDDEGILQGWTLEVCISGGGGCQANLTPGSNIASGTYHASVSVSSDGTVQNGSTVIFKAGTEINLQNNFEVQLGGVFDAIIEACTPAPLQVETGEGNKM